MKTLSHRGLTTSARENTAAAFAAAVAAGVDGIETDVRRTQDGVLVLYHDRHLPSGRAVADTTFADMKHDHPELQLLRVEEALARWPSLLWNLEVKTAQAMDPLITLLKRTPLQAEVLITSFDHTALEHAAPPPKVRLGVLVAHSPFRTCTEPLGHWPRIAGLDTIVWAFETLALKEVQRALGRGVRSLVYGPESAEEHKALLGLPLFGVITDHPERMPRPVRPAPSPPPP
jgi:glycerophosphoryl diester phosphodiesterase